jgi:AraC-like DNA-binding protein
MHRSAVMPQPLPGLPRPSAAPPELGSTVHAGAVLHVVEEAGRVGLDPRSLLGEAALEQASLSDPDQRIPLERYVALWKAASARFTREPLGLVVGRGHRPEYGGVVMYLIGHSATLGESLERARRYQRLANEIFIAELAVENGVAHFQRELPPALAEVGAIAEMIAMMWVTLARLFTGTDWWPREVTFQHACTGDPRLYAEAFHCPVRFNQPRTRVSAEPSVLDRSIPRADARLCAYLERHATALLERTPGEESLGHQVRRLLLEELRGGDPSQEHIAKRLALGARTLQRRLKDEGLVFNDLLDGLRQELSRMHLKERSLSVQQVAFLLGYSEPSGFHRAFRRWTGTTPQEFRAQSGSGRLHEALHAAR